MNDRYFCCNDCCSYVDAGYRWAYWELEHVGIVRIGQRIDPDRVADVDSPAQFDWVSALGDDHPSPRFFAEILGLRDWAEVERWVASHREPWWWRSHPEQLEWAREKFGALVGLETGRGRSES